MKSFNIVAETTGFVALVYSNINPQNIELVIQLFSTLNEFTVVCVLVSPRIPHFPSLSHGTSVSSFFNSVPSWNSVIKILDFGIYYFCFWTGRGNETF